MKLIVDMGLDNAAFEGSEGPAEAARILRVLADEMEGNLHELKPGSTTHQLRDINGNRVGIAYITDL